MRTHTHAVYNWYTMQNKKEHWIGITSLSSQGHELNNTVTAILHVIMNYTVCTYMAKYNTLFVLAGKPSSILSLLFVLPSRREIPKRKKQRKKNECRINLNYKLRVRIKCD